MASVNGESPDNFLFLQASDHNNHTGKTYLTNLLLAKIRLGGNVALAVASSGIATCRNFAPGRPNSTQLL